MRTFICIDDTDNIDSRGTGELASIIAKHVETEGWGATNGITRHQLFIHPDIPYTSHNSSMCFEAELREDCLETLIHFTENFLETESAEGSDPGLCIAVEKNIKSKQAIMEFGKRAKNTVVTKAEAYGLAKELEVHLSEHGGTGAGIIGALAGVGLRITGNDGRFKGKIKLASVEGKLEVSNILAQTFIDRVMEMEGDVLAHHEIVHVGEVVKAVFLDGKATLLVLRKIEEATGEIFWQACSNQQLKVF